MQLIAHRTPAESDACRRLADQGATHFEVDVRLDARGRPVVSHFQPLFRIPGWLEVDGARLRVAGRVDPPLDAVVGMLPPAVGVLLDLKEKAGDRRLRLARTLRDSCDPGRFCVSTGNTDDLDVFRAAGFDTWLTLANLPALYRGPRGYRTVTVQHRLLDERVIDALKARVVRVIAWTVNDVSRARTLVRSGVDGITTDDGRVMEAVRA